MTAAPDTRGRPGRIDQLPEEIRERLDAMLRGGVTQREILRRLEAPLREIGEAPLSRSGLNRYATRMARLGHRIREYREISRMWQDQYGAAGGQVGMQIIEMLRTVAWDLAERAMAESGDPDADLTLDAAQLRDLALSVGRLERAAEVGAQRERAIRAEVAEAAATQAAASAAEAAREAGHALPAAALERIRREVYGLHDG